ncbi:MAG: RNA polymerase factor sigma-54 [Candidatus Margulisbacteria bacterium]|nr:RNA polymerase factor sigma-54 [Candidatus Margulisiibacteriota bacterium]
MLGLRVQHDLKQTLDLLLSPRMLQMLKILSLPYLELVDRIAKEAEENVLLEVERQDEYVEFIRYLTSDKKIKKEADFTELPGLENIGSVTKTLEDHLLEQLELEDLPEAHFNIAQKIIDNIDDFGFVINYVRLREGLMKEFDVSRPTVDKVLKIVQGFEPEGVGARDLKECLLIQIEAYNFENEALQEILAKAVEKHLEDLGNQDYKKIAASLGLPESGVAEIAAFIKNNLNPNPGSSFGGETKHVIPSYAVEKADKGFKLVNLETRYGPVINLSPSYLKMLDNPKTDAKTREFLKAKLKAAKELIEDFSRRSETLEKIVRKITESQQVFFSKGITWLVPLSQKSLADEFGLHPSTISRTVAEKYIQTPHGLFPLKFLCPRGPKGLTVPRTKAMLVELLKHENKGNPFTDSQLTEAMQKQGAKIDRRTVAYYRKELGYPSSSERQAE